MSTQSFKDLIVWQKSFDLTLCVYKSLEDCRDYGFKDQIQRASVSIMNNIAEGYAKRSDKSFKNYLSIAKGSAAEVESMLLLAKGLGYIETDKQKVLMSKVDEVGKMISGFIRKLSAKDY